MDNRPLDIEEVAALFSVSTRTIRKWMDAGMPVLSLPSPRILRFDPQACIEWARTRQESAV
jgi:phage terminase Nu1 subunit (DNA packaging protein)